MRISAWAAVQELARRAKEELAKRRERPEFKEDVIRQLTADLFPLQRTVLDDPKALIAICCGRRAGKSELAARMIAIELLRAQHNECVLFAAQTLQRAKQIIWKLLDKINTDYGLGWTMSEHIGQITTPEGAVCMMLGVTDANSIEKVRGSKYRLAICDETSTYEGLLERLVIDVILPGTLDFTPRGKIILTGTPGYSRAGWWYEVATGIKKGWSQYHWWMGDNPTIGDIESKLREMRDEMELSEDDPKYKREVLGLWVSDESVLVYSATEQRNSCKVLPGNPSAEEIREHWLVTCALDVGFTDACALAAVGSPPNSKEMFVLESFKASGLRADEQAAKLKEFRDKYRPARTVMDIGGQGKLVHAEFNHRYGKMSGGVAIPAKKMGKVEAIGMFNSDMRTGALKAYLPAAADVFKEWTSLPWLEGSDKTKADPKFDNHASDATLYAWREHRAFLAKPAVTKTAEDLAAEEVAALKAKITKRK